MFEPREVSVLTGKKAASGERGRGRTWACKTEQKDKENEMMAAEAKAVVRSGAPILLISQFELRHEEDS